MIFMCLGTVSLISSDPPRCKMAMPDLQLDRNQICGKIYRSELIKVSKVPL